MFRDVRSRIAGADLAIGNLEGTFSVGGASKCGSDGGQCFSFQAPPGNAGALRWAGFDLMNLANNHSYDFGSGGLDQTIEALDARALAHTGRPGQITVVRRRGIRLAAIGFAPYDWASDLRNLAAATALVRQAARQAELVVVLAHMGGEGAGQSRVPHGREVAMGEDRGDTRAFAHAVVEAGADLVLGSGPHYCAEWSTTAASSLPTPSESSPAGTTSRRPERFPSAVSSPSASPPKGCCAEGGSRPCA